MPKEWFVVPLHVIREAIELFIDGTITDLPLRSIDSENCADSKISVGTLAISSKDLQELKNLR